VADPAGAVSLASKAAGDLFWRPGLLQTGDDVPRQVRILMQLASADAAPIRSRLGRLGEVATQPGAVVVPVAPDLAVDGRAMPAEPLGDPRHGHLRFAQLENQLPLVQGEVVVARSQGPDPIPSQPAEKLGRSHLEMESTQLQPFDAQYIL